MNLSNQSRRKSNRHARRGERGYAMIAIIGIMMFALILTTVAAPQIKKEAQREREAEMLWRGEQIRLAIERYLQARGGRFPTDLNDLVEGVDVGLKKKRFLRPSALCDPMRPCSPPSTNWNLVHFGDQEPAELRDAVRAYLQRMQPGVPQPPGSLGLLDQVANAGMKQLPGGEADTKLDGNIGPGTPQEGDSNSDSGSALNKRPIVGVTSTSTEKPMFRTYYGIDDYQSALFFPTVPVPVSGSFAPPPGAFGSNAFTPAVENTRCPDGGVRISGQCYGGLRPGMNCRGPNGETIPCAGK